MIIGLFLRENSRDEPQSDRSSLYRRRLPLLTLEVVDAIDRGPEAVGRE